MLFNSAIFLLLFVPACLAINFCLKDIRAKNAFLLAASILFYWFGEPVLIFLLMIAIVVNYFAALAIQSSEQKDAQKILFAISFFNFGLLCWYKYSAFLLTTFNQVFHTSFSTHVAGNLIPLGISFYVFHFISYTVDVYRKTVPAQRNPINVGLYVLFFPQLVAGPLVRYHYMAPQFLQRKINSEMFSSGLNRFIIGLSKKCLIADPLGRIVEPMFKIPGNEVTTVLAWAAIVGFIFQLFFDFSGYADIAIGLGKMFGFNLPENFNRPLSSTSVTEFWRRWHIQLGLWLHQYLYQPLARPLAKTLPTKHLSKFMSQSHASEARTCLNTFLLFFTMGIWHGASWNFVWFGIITALLVVVERLFLLQWLQKLPAMLQRVYLWAMLASVMLLFRTDSVDRAFHFFKAMIGLQEGNRQLYPNELFINSYFLSLLAVSAFLCIEWPRIMKKIQVLRPVRIRLYTVRHALRVCSNVPLYALCLAEVAAATQNPFLYFKF